MADFSLIVTEALAATGRGGPPTADPARIDKIVSILERCGLGWIARVARASLALTSQADGCEAAHAVREECDRDCDRWGAALASLFEGVGLSQRGRNASDAFDASALAFTELGADSMASFVDRRRSTTATVVRGGGPHVGASMRVQCFDALELVVDGRRVDLTAVRPRALSVLRLLALHAGRAVHCETLMNALWPDVEPDAARRSLQVAVSSLRKALPRGPAAAIMRHGDAYRLELHPEAFFDVRSFRSLLSSANDAVASSDPRRALDVAMRAAEVYRGDLLLDEGPAEWVVGPRDAFRHDMVRACLIAGEAAVKLGLPSEASRLAAHGARGRPVRRPAVAAAHRVTRADRATWCLSIGSGARGTR